MIFTEAMKQSQISQLSVNMVKTVLAGVNIVERGLQQFSGSDHPDQPIIVLSIFDFFFFYRIPVENFCVDSKSFPLEAFGI